MVFARIEHWEIVEIKSRNSLGKHDFKARAIMMKKTLSDLSRKNDRITTGKPSISLRLFLLAGVLVLVTTGCYHKPAIEGAPVKDLVKERNVTVIRPEIMTGQKKEDLRKEKGEKSFI